MSSKKNTTRKKRKTADEDEDEEEEEDEEEVQEIELQENDTILMNATIEKKVYLNQYAKMIEKEITDLEPGYTYTPINGYTYIEIDGIDVTIYIGKDKNKKDSYKYQINVDDSIMESEDTDRNDIDIVLLSGKNYKNILSILEHIEEVKNSYKFIEHYLRSPDRIQYINTQRKIYPIPPDKKCSVCYEPTIEYTVCQHPICFRCRYTCIVSDNLMCPICRNGELKLFPKELAPEGG